MKIAKVGDYVRITKIPQIKGYSEVLKVGDVGKVTYLANTTMKYSVHVDSKKNPADIAHPNSRAYGDLYDFWIPKDCCEIIKTKFKVGDKVNIHNTVRSDFKKGIVKGYTKSDNMEQYLVLVDDVKLNTNRKDGCRYFLERQLELQKDEEDLKYLLTDGWRETSIEGFYIKEDDDLMRQCLFENADALDKWQATWDDVPVDIKELVEMGLFTKEEALAKCSNHKYQEREENKMKEIKNQKVVDLYYERKEKELKDAMNADIEAAESIDKHQKFVADLKKQFEKYVENTELKTEPKSFDVSLPYTEECVATVEKIREQCLDSIKKVRAEKAEVIAMLSGCETYDQEMTILRSYGIVGKDNKLVGQTN